MTPANEGVLDRPFLTIPQVAAHWQVSTKKVLRLIQKGELIAHKFGAQWRIAHADLVNFERLHRLG